MNLYVIWSMCHQRFIVQAAFSHLAVTCIQARKRVTVASWDVCTRLPLNAAVEVA